MFLLVACDPTEPNARQLVENALETHGHAAYQQGVISFRTGGIQYRVLRHQDAFVYSRTFRDATGQRVHDVVQNSGFTRTINDQEEKLGEVTSSEIAASVMKEVFMVLLPYGLDQPGLEKRYEGDIDLDGEPYHKVRFRMAAGSAPGGKDMELIGWFHEQQHTLDYVAFEIQKDGAGQFWVAKNPRKVGGMRFQDYDIYSSTNRISLERLDQAYKTGKLEKVSVIKLEEVKASELPGQL